MAKDKNDAATVELPGIPKRRGRPKGDQPAKTAAERMRAYRARKTAEKDWSYKDLTTAAETEIKIAIHLANTTPALWEQYMAQAQGIYWFWNGLTMGWQEAGDGERLRRLALQIKD